MALNGLKAFFLFKEKNKTNKQHYSWGKTQILDFEVNWPFKLWYFGKEKQSLTALKMALLLSVTQAWQWASINSIRDLKMKQLNGIHPSSYYWPLCFFPLTNSDTFKRPVWTPSFYLIRPLLRLRFLLFVTCINMVIECNFCAVWGTGESGNVSQRGPIIYVI